MNITLLGAGNIGGTLGKKWAAAGHAVVFGIRDPDGPGVKELVASIEGNVSASSVAESLNAAEVVLFAIPSAAMPETVEAHAAALQGKIVIDATNRFGGAVISSVSIIQERAPGAVVFRAFNSLGWEIFARPAFGKALADLFYSGPEGEGRAVVERLIGEIGLRPVYVGGLDQVYLVDNLGALWVHLAFRRGMGRRIALKLLVDGS